MSRKTKKILVYLLIPLFPLFLIFLDQTLFHSFKMQFVEAGSWPLRIVLFPVNEIKKILTYHSTYNRYLLLKEEVETLKSRLIGQEEMLKENQRFKKLLEFKNTLVFSSVASNVIARDPDNWTASILIDRGKRDGIKIGMPVLSPLGVVGKISQVGTSVSKVMLLTDPNFSVAALTKGQREVGLVSGTLEPICRMKYVKLEANIKIGDEVITSKISSSFPEGLLIGRVIDIFESPTSPTLECLVEPAVSLSQVEEVLVILN